MCTKVSTCQLFEFYAFKCEQSKFLSLNMVSMGTFVGSCEV
jgi:hypothetical protein